MGIQIVEVFRTFVADKHFLAISHLIDEEAATVLFEAAKGTGFSCESEGRAGTPCSISNGVKQARFSGPVVLFQAPQKLWFCHRTSDDNCFGPFRLPSLP